MNEPFTFYRAVDPMKGSWDGYGYFPGAGGDFFGFVTDAPSGASIHTPELIKNFWKTFAESSKNPSVPVIEFADAINRLQHELQQRGRRENVLYQATLAAVWKIGPKLLHSCIGDSSLHLIRKKKLYRLNESEIWDGSLITQEGLVYQERQKTTAIRFIGSNGQFVETAGIRTLDLQIGDMLLFTTDGVEDLLSPDTLLKLVAHVNSPDDIRQQLDSVFAQDKLKDDATLMLVPVELDAELDLKKEFSAIHTHMEKLQKEQSELRNQLLEFGQTKTRIEKLETSLHQLSNEARRSSRAGHSGAHSTPARSVSYVSNRKQWPISWIAVVLALLVGTAAGAFLFRDRGTPSPTITQKKEAPLPRAITPPEIPSPEDCTYTVQKGDTLDKIASNKNVTVEQLLSWNPAQKRNAPLAIGKTLIVCKEGS